MDIFPTAFIKIAILLNPFAVLTTFLALTASKTARERTAIVVRTCGAVAVAGLVVLFSGNALLAALGVGLAPFKVGGGVVLMACSITLVWGSSRNSPAAENADGSISVVPLAIPYTVGPGTVGTLLVMSAAKPPVDVRVTEIIGIVFAVGVLGLLLFFSDTLEELLKRKGINILSKLTGLYLVALASQIIFEGIKNILNH